MSLSEQRQRIAPNPVARFLRLGRTVDGQPYVTNGAARRHLHALNVRDFGAKGDGGTDDTAAFKRWAADLVGGGHHGIIPRGRYRLTDEVVVDLTGYDTENAELGVTIDGGGAGNTTLLVDHAGAGLRVQGGTGAAALLRSRFRGLRFQAATAHVGTGLVVDKCAFAEFDDIFCRVLNLGVQAKDIVSATFMRLNTAFCRYGVDLLGRDVVSSPNALGFYNPSIRTSLEWGMRIKNSGTVSIVNGSIEGNGRDGSEAQRWGLRLEESGRTSGVGLHMVGSYLEGNGGQADLWIVHGEYPCTYTVGSTVFHRIHDPAVATQHHIRVDADPGTTKGKLLLTGNGHRRFGAYTADASRRYVRVFQPTSGRFVVEDAGGSFYQDAVEDVAVRPVVAYAHCTFVGTGSPPSLLEPHNVTSVERVGTGDYRVNLRQPGPWTVTNAKVFVGLNAPGVGVKFGGVSGEQIRVRTYDLSGALTDFSQVSFLMFAR